MELLVLLREIRLLDVKIWGLKAIVIPETSLKESSASAVVNASHSKSTILSREF
jgi:hypothetical protein